MKALTVRQPWCSAIAFGDKRVENRPRRTYYQGPLALHAGLAVEWRGATDRAWTAAGLTPYRPGDPRDAWRGSLPLGALIAVAEVLGCHSWRECYNAGIFPEKGTMCLPWAARGQWHIVLGHVRPLLQPVPCKGALGLWTVPEDAERAVSAQITEESADAR